MQEDEIFVYMTHHNDYAQNKRELSRLVDIQVKEFLAKGGKITVADQGDIKLDESHPHSFDRRFLVK